MYKLKSLYNKKGVDTLTYRFLWFQNREIVLSSGIKLLSQVSFEFMHNKILSPTCSIFDLPIMIDGICPNNPGSLLWPSSHVPDIDICDKTGLIGTAVYWPSCASEDGISVSAGSHILGLSSCGASAEGLAAPEPLPCSSSSITHS